MRRNSVQTCDGGGRMNRGIFARPGSHSQAARKASSTATHAMTVLWFRLLDMLAALARGAAALLDELVRVEVGNRRFPGHEAFLHIEFLHRREALRIHGAEHLLARVHVAVVELEDRLDVRPFPLVL